MELTTYEEIYEKLLLAKIEIDKVEDKEYVIMFKRRILYYLRDKKLCGDELRKAILSGKEDNIDNNRIMDFVILWRKEKDMKRKFSGEEKKVIRLKRSNIYYHNNKELYKSYQSYKKKNTNNIEVRIINTDDVLYFDSINKMNKELKRTTIKDRSKGNYIFCDKYYFNTKTALRQCAISLNKQK